ncbi:hypothetical protein VTO42DRAFT_2756 [Malbranchea cinnamomea]
MKRFLGSLRRSPQLSSQRSSRDPSPTYHPESPEAVVVREVIAFCETGRIDKPGHEYLHLPAIVEAAESGPAASQAAARQIHKFLSNPKSRKRNRQYYAIMLLKILAENPGETFTRHIDSQFVTSIKNLLREGQDINVQQILLETLESLAQGRSGDQNLAQLLEMWGREKERFAKYHRPPPVAPVAFAQRPDGYFARHQRSHELPPSEELAARIFEANSTAKLLVQMVQSTPTGELLQNDLAKEFAQRCQLASRSIQHYINDTNPAPDEDTMLTLIETNDKLSVALSKYQRAVVNARKAQAASQPQIQQSSRVEEPKSHVNAAESIPIPRNRFVPRLSMPEKPLRNKQSERSEQPAQPSTQPMQQKQPTQVPGVARPPSPNVSPIAPVGPTLWSQPSATNGSTATTKDNRETTFSTGFQYNSNDFQIENPFADKFSTAIDNTTDDTQINSNTYQATSTSSRMFN